MATTKPKKTAKKSSTKTKAAVKSTRSVKTKKTSVKTASAVATQTRVEKTNDNVGFFAKKFDATENILTIFKRKEIYGAILGEVVGTMLITVVLLTLGIYQPLYIMLAMIGITAMVFKLSGANLNPLITVGMMATRRMSAIRGVLYIIAQVLGAWFALLIVNAFRTASGTSAELPVMSEVESDMFWFVTLVEFFGSTIIGFTFARALQYKRKALAFATIVASGIMVALIAAIVISGSFANLNNSFAMNPAVALMYQILPTTGDNVGALLGDIALALVTYVIFPMLGGVIGFYISDLASFLTGEDTRM